MGAERLQGNRGKSPAETRFLCLPVSPAPGEEVTQRLHRPCESNAAPLAAPYDIFPLRKIKERRKTPPRWPGGDRWMDQATVKKAGETERWTEAAGEVRGRKEGGREMRGSDATEKRV